ESDGERTERCQRPGKRGVRREEKLAENQRCGGGGKKEVVPLQDGSEHARNRHPPYSRIVCDRRVRRVHRWSPPSCPGANGVTGSRRGYARRGIAQILIYDRHNIQRLLLWRRSPSQPRTDLEAWRGGASLPRTLFCWRQLSPPRKRCHPGPLPG